MYLFRARRLALSIVVLAVAAAAGTVPAATSIAAAAKCSKTQASVTVNGAAACRSLRSMAPIKRTESDATYVGRRLLGIGGITFPTPKLKNGTPLPAMYTRAEAMKLVTAMRILETQGMAAATAVLQPGSRAAGASLARARAAREATPAGVTVNQPEVTGTIGDRSASVTISATADGGDGSSTKMTATIEAKLGDDGRADADVSFDLAQTRAGVTRSNGLKAGILGSRSDSCPDANGYISYSETYRLSTNDGISESFGPINLGSITRIDATNSSASGTARMNVDATLLPIPFRVSASRTQSLTGTGVAQVAGSIIGGLYSMSATATAAGTINPKTGAIESSSRFDVRTTGTGPAALRASVAKAALDEARRMIGTQYKDLKDLEKRARAGECTKLEFDAASGSKLAPGGKLAVKATQLGTSGAEARNPVMWTIAATHGKVTPATGTKNDVATTVTGAAAKNGSTAVVRYKAVSRMGIENGTWTGIATPYPKSYTGTFEYDFNYLPAGTAFVHEKRTGNVSYALDHVTNNPDGSTSLWYTANTATVTSASYDDWVPCTSAVTLGTNTIKSGDVEIIISPAGAWKGAMQIDIDMGESMVNCPPPIPSTSKTMKTVFNSRTSDATPQLRPMEPKGAIAGTATGEQLYSFGVTGTATWNLTPGA